MATIPAFILPAGLEPETSTRLELVLSRLYGMDSILVAFSGGVDSALVLKAALEAAPGRVLAATGLSASYADEEIAEAKSVAAQLGAEHQMVNTMELTDPRYADNTHQRCFFCKSELYSQLNKVAEALGFAAVVDGTNADDGGDFRPGIRAAEQLGVISPLAEAGMTKREIREAARAWGVPIWDKPAAACLSSRFQYGDPITVEKLRQVAAAEKVLRAIGMKGFRVRHHDDVARLEIPDKYLDLVNEHRAYIVEGIKAAGYRFVALDLEGFRTGSMNGVLNARVKSAGLRRESAD